MSYGAGPGVSLDSYDQQLPYLQHIPDHAEVGVDGKGRIVQKTEGNERYFAQYQDTLVQQLVADPRQKYTKQKYTRLRDRDISIPAQLTMGSLRLALKELGSYEKVHMDRLKTYFPGNLLEETQKYNPDLYQKILSTPLADVDKLAVKARMEKEDRDFEFEMQQALKNSTQLHASPSTPPPPQPSVTNPVKTASPQHVKAVQVPDDQKAFFKMIKDELGQYLNDHQIALGLEKRVFNSVTFYPTSSQRAALKQDKDRFVTAIGKLEEAPTYESRNPPAQQAVSQSPVRPSAASTLPSAIPGLMDNIRQASFNTSGGYYNVSWAIDRMNQHTKGYLDHPELLAFLDELIPKMNATTEYLRDDKCYRIMQDAASKLPDCEFKRRLQKGFRPVTSPAPSVQPRERTREPSPPTRPVQQDDSRRTSVSPTASPRRSPPRVQKSAAEQVGERKRMNPDDLQVFMRVFGDSQDTRHMEQSLEACRYLYNLGCNFPFEFLLQGMRRYPEEVRKIAEYRPGNYAASNRAIAEPFMRQCVLDYANFRTPSKEAEKFLTTINLWHQPDLLEQVEPLHHMNNLYTALKGKPLDADQLLFALADNKMTPLAIKRLYKFPSVQALADSQIEAAKNPDIRLIANSVDGSGQYPSPEAIRVCMNVARYASGAMGEDGYLENKESIDRAMDAISYSWVPEYLGNPPLLQRFIRNVIKGPLSDDNVRYLSWALDRWYQASKNGQGGEFMMSLHPNARADLRYLYDQLAFANLQKFSEQLLQLEPLISGSAHVQNFKENIEMGMGFFSKGHQDKVGKKFHHLGLKPGQRTIPDNNCGYYAIAMMTGDAPMDVRKKAQKAAQDMDSYLKNGDLRGVKGDEAYRQRVKKAAESFKEKSWIEGLKEPKDRLHFVGTDPLTVDFSKDPKLNQSDYWMTDEDRQYIAVAYGRPVFPLAEVDEGNQSFGKYITAEGELKYTLDGDDFYEEGLAVLKRSKPEPLAMINLGHFRFAHWMPTEPVPLPRNTRTHQIKTVHQPDRDEMLMSLRRDREEHEHYLNTLKHNPRLIPQGQDMFQRAESPDYYSSLGQDSLKQLTQLHENHRQRLDASVRDPLMSLHLGAIGPQAGTYQSLTRPPMDDNLPAPDLEMSLTSLNIQPMRQELPPPDAAQTPGFRNFGARTCFCNAGLKQLITGMSMDEVETLKNKAYALRRQHPGIYEHEYETTYGKRQQFRDGGKRADLMLRFADLAEATMKARSGQGSKDVEHLLHDFHLACYELGQSRDIEQRAFKRLYPNGAEQDFGGPQLDSTEFMTKLLEIIDEDNQLSNPVSEAYIIKTTDGSQQRKDRTGSPLRIISVPIDGRSLEECLAPRTEAMKKKEWVIFSDKKEHPGDKTDYFAHPEPKAVHRLNLQVKAYLQDDYGRTRKLTEEARKLVLDHPFERVNVPLVNQSTGQLEQVPMEVKSFTAHIGDSPAGGHYVTFEKQGQQWFLNDDGYTSPVNLKAEFARQKGMVPYSFQFESAAKA